jgi:hypothetical protein
MSNKKLLFGIAGIFGVVILLGLIGVVAFAVYITPPSAEAVCEKVMDLSRSEYETATGQSGENLGEEDLLGQTKDECIKDEERRAEVKGLLTIKEERQCILDAENFEQAIDCQE